MHGTNAVYRAVRGIHYAIKYGQKSKWEWKSIETHRFSKNYEICLNRRSVHISKHFISTNFSAMLFTNSHNNARSCLTRIYLIAWFPHLTHGNKNFFGAAACNGSSYVKQQLIWWQYVISLEWALCEDKNKLKEHLIYLNGSIVWVVMGWCAFMIVHHDFCLCGYFNHFHCFHRINSLQPHFIKQPCTETFILQKNNEIFAIASLFILLYAVFKIASKKCCFKSLVFRKLN